MLQPMEAMLPRWPLLYPETTDAGEQNGNGPDWAAKVRRQVIAPILESWDISHIFGEMSQEYKKWRDSRAANGRDLETLLAQEDRKDDALIAAFSDHRELLGDAAVKAAMENIRLRKIVRRSTLPHRETWPEESWEKIAHLMTSSELCHAGIMEYITTGEGSKDNVETLAAWGFQYALDAYWDAGYYGQNSTKLEDIFCDVTAEDCSARIDDEPREETTEDF